MRLLLLFLALVALVLIPFFIWEDFLNAVFTPEGSIDWLRQYGAWGWAAGRGLLIADLFLPIPGTLIISALGYIYGPWLGGLLASLGSFLSGELAYGLCRLTGRKGALRILGEKDLARGEKLFARTGGWIVALSRWLPVFPEVVACMAGLTHMPARTFHFALACGSLPLGFAFAAVGHMGVEYPALALIVSAVAPPILWLAVRPAFLKKARSNDEKSP